MTDAETYECPVCGSEFSTPRSRGGHFGLSHSDSEKEDALICRLQNLCEGLERIPKRCDMEQCNWASKSTVASVFGSWTKGLVAAGITPARRTNIEKEELLSVLQELADEIDRTPRQKDMDERGEFSSIVYIRRFGCWNDALQEIGLTPNRPGSISKEQLLTELKRVADDLGKTPTREEFDACSRYSAGTYHVQFGGWNEALKIVGLDPNRHCNVDKEELIQELNRLNDTLGHAPTIADAAKEGRYGTATFERTFGSWNNALKAAGFDVHNRSGIEEEELIDELHRLKESLGKPPTVCQNREHGQFSLGAYQRVFGTWNNAIQAAELDRNHRLAIPRTELLDELSRLAADLGKVPTVSEMDAHGEFSRVPYQQEFGGWRKALAAIGFSPSETRRITDHPIYGIGWTKKRRERVRNRDGHICGICGVTQSEHLEKNDTRLHVHHICGARESTNPAVFNADRNLLTVCADCHKTIECHVPGLPPNVLQPSRSLNSD